MPAFTAARRVLGLTPGKGGGARRVIPAGNRNSLPSANNGLLRYSAGSRRSTVGPVAVTELRVVIPNFYVNASGIFTRMPADWVARVSIRYPAGNGTVYRGTKDGSYDIPVSAADAFAVSDVFVDGNGAPLALPAGAIYDRIFYMAAASAILPTGQASSAAIDTYYGSTTTPPATDPTIAGASVGQTGTGYGLAPWFSGVAYGGPVVPALLADSIGFGVSATTADANGDVSYMDKLVNPASPMLNLSSSGRRIEHYMGAVVTGSIATDGTLTISAATVGQVAVGMRLYGPNIKTGVTITALGTSTGGVGTCTVSPAPAQAVASSSLAGVSTGLDDLKALLAHFTISLGIDALGINDLGAARSQAHIRACKIALKAELSTVLPKMAYNTITPRTAGLTVTSLTSSSTTATATVASTAQWTNGQSVIIAGASPSAYNGTYSITITGPTTFTYTFAGGTSPATGGLIVADDGGVTVGGQALYASGSIEAPRLALNTDIRTGYFSTLYLEAARAAADKTDEGKWVAGRSTDHLHPKDLTAHNDIAGEQLLIDSWAAVKAA